MKCKDVNNHQLYSVSESICRWQQQSLSFSAWSCANSKRQQRAKVWVVLNGPFSVRSLCAGADLSFLITLLSVSQAMSLISSDHWSTRRCLERLLNYSLLPFAMSLHIQLGLFQPLALCPCYSPRVCGILLFLCPSGTEGIGKVVLGWFVIFFLWGPVSFLGLHSASGPRIYLFSDLIHQPEDWRSPLLHWHSACDRAEELVLGPLSMSPWIQVQACPTPSIHLLGSLLGSQEGHLTVQTQHLFLHICCLQESSPHSSPHVGRTGGFQMPKARNRFLFLCLLTCLVLRQWTLGGLAWRKGQGTLREGRQEQSTISKHDPLMSACLRSLDFRLRLASYGMYTKSGLLPVFLWPANEEWFLHFKWLPLTSLWANYIINILYLLLGP